MHARKPMVWAIVALFLLAACATGTPNTSTLPEVTAEATVLQDISSIESNVISVRLDAIRLAERTVVEAIPLDTVWVIPVGANREVNANMQYVEQDRQILITRDRPYTPTSPWFLSIERKDLEDQNFGIWFIVSNTGDMGLITRELFLQVIQDSAAVIAAGGVAMLLAPLTPGIPDEAVAAAVAVSRGRALIGTTTAFGLALSGDMIQTFTERQVDNVFTLAEQIDKVSYFTEVYVIIPAANNYYLNNQISVTTVDGSLELIFSIWETSNNAAGVDFIPTETRSDVFPPASCNPNLESSLTAGSRARVTRTTNAITRMFEQTVAFRLREGEVVRTILPFCDFTEQVLWWRIENEASEIGWIPESRGASIFVEPIND